ncbi:MAG: PIN domain-containing protein [Armatimonadota bacterium]
MPLRLIDSSVWISFLRPNPHPRLVRAVRRALASGEAATAAPIVVEVLSGIRNADEYAVREEEFRSLRSAAVDGEAAFLGARIGEGLARAGKMSKTVDVLLAAAAIHSNAELWSLADEHFKEIQTLIAGGEVRVPRPFRLLFLP